MLNVEGGVFTQVFPKGNIGLSWRKESLFGTVHAVEEQEGGQTTSWVVKIVRPIAGQDPTFLNQATESFRAGLAHCGVQLSARYRFFVIEGQIAVQVSSYEGPDLEEILRQEPQRVETELAAVIRSIHGVLVQTEPRVGLDPQLANFAAGGRYIDIFPPLVRFRGGYLVHYPNPTDPEQVRREIERKFNPTGILRKLRFFLMAVNPNWDIAFERAVEPILLDRRLKVTHEILHALPDRELRDVSSGVIVAAIEQHCQPGLDVETMREIAARVTPADWPARYDFLCGGAFRLSSVYGAPGYPDAYEERLNSLRYILLQFVEGVPPDSVLAA